MASLRPAASVRLVGLLVLLAGLAPGARASSAPPLPRASVTRPAALGLAADGVLVYGLPHSPVHLWQYNPAPAAYRNPQGCGAFSTAMALSVYDPVQYGTYPAARRLFGAMLPVPLFGGTFESQNAVVARRAGYIALNQDHGTVAELVAAIDLGAPVILLLDPNWLGIGQHDVVLVGYRVGSDGQVRELLVDNPARAEAGRAEAPGEPGNQVLAVSALPQTWTGVFTAIFADLTQAATWRAATGR